MTTKELLEKATARPPYQLMFKGVASCPSWRIADKEGQELCRFQDTTQRTAESITEKAKLVLRAVNSFEAMREALSFYMSICGNTAYSVTRESAQQAHDMGTAALVLAEGKAAK